MIMYKIILPALLFFGVPALSLAQAPPTLTAANMSPVAGDQFVIHNCSTSNVEPGANGADTSWDFSALYTLTSQGSVDTGTAIPASSTQTFALYSASNLAIITPSSSLVTYYIASDAKLSQDGIYSSPTQYTVYSDPMDQLQFPFTFNNTFTDSYSGLIVYTPSGGPTVHGLNAGSITVTADAYGALTLPGTSAPVVYPNTLRVHSIQTYQDSVNIFAAPVVETFTVETYTWYTPGYRNALLTIATSVGPGVNDKQVAYSSRQIAGAETVSSVGEAGASYLNMYPNPVNSELNIAYNTSGNEQVRLSISDMLGREVAVIADKSSQGVQNLAYNTSSLPKGLYLIRFQTKAETITRKVTVQ